jgi:hypothetical protein
VRLAAGWLERQAFPSQMVVDWRVFRLARIRWRVSLA